MKKTMDNAHDIAEQYMLEVIKSEHPDWVEKDGSCKRCEEYYLYLDEFIDYDSA